MRVPLFALAVTGALLLAGPSWSQQPAGDETLTKEIEALRAAQQDLDHRLDQLAKAIDDIAWFQRVGDVAVVDKWRIVGPPDVNPKNPTAPGATNPVKFYTYTFVPKDRKSGEKLPMLILPHGGVHADFTTYHTHIIRELMAQGYVVVAPDYRGSTGYGKAFYQLIDYGGREVDDIHASTQWAL
ncbi:MAG TPA: prolyl oligopeptidase family serine peptidase, partial [Thermoanaerobaculaceae bacterium]|nr:prolyl oligopeptidase family serine peptidase [Thermoanaerobaculaceae bacterium]